MLRTNDIASTVAGKLARRELPSGREALTQTSWLTRLGGLPIPPICSVIPCRPPQAG